MNKNIGFIGGGQMAEALIRGILRSQTAASGYIRVSEPDAARQEHLKAAYGVRCCDSAEQLLQQSQTIILAVKPQVMPLVLAQIKPEPGRHLLITIAAGLPLALYNAHLDNPDISIVRVMPNMPALIGAGVSALCRNARVSDAELAYAESLFKAVGSTVVVEEKALDAVTGLSGSGPAFVFSFIEALIDGGVKVGLSREIAGELARQTVLGATRLAIESGEHPAVLRDRVASPGGTTISGLHLLEESGFRGIVMSAVEAACHRSIELGKS